MKKQIIADGAYAAPQLLSQAIEANGFIFTAGIVHVTPDGKLVEGTTEDKVRSIMENLEKILKTAGSDFSNVVKVTIYLTDIALLKEFNQIYITYFTAPFPVREAICVKALPLGANIEVSMIAAKE